MGTRVTCLSPSLSLSLPSFPARVEEWVRLFFYVCIHFGAFHWFTIIDNFTAYYWKVTKILQYTSIKVEFETDFQVTHSHTCTCTCIPQLIVHSLHSKVYHHIDEQTTALPKKHGEYWTQCANKCTWNHAHHLTMPIIFIWLTVGALCFFCSYSYILIQKYGEILR